MIKIIFIFWVILSTCYLLTRRKFKGRNIAFIVIIHAILIVAGLYINHIRIEKSNEYVAYAYEQYATECQLDNFGSETSWIYRRDPIAEKMENEIDMLQYLLFACIAIDIIYVFYIANTHKRKEVAVHHLI